VHGAGRVDAERVAAGVLGAVPSAEPSRALRCAREALAEALARRGGVHGLRALGAALHAAAAGAGAAARLSPRAARAVLDAELGGEARAAADALVREAARPAGGASLRAAALVEALRGPLSRRARAAADAAWARAGGGPALPVAALAAAPARALSLAGGLIAADFARVWGGALSASAERVTASEWLDYARDVRAAAGSDAAFAGALAGAWGGAPAPWSPRDDALPGSPAAAVREPPPHSPTAAARRAAASPLGSEATAVPVVLGAALGRSFAAHAHEPMFGAGSRVAVPNAALLGRAAGGGVAEAAATRAAHASRARDAADAARAAAAAAAAAATYARVRHTKTTSGFLLGGASIALGS
jgi:hypothetical protein